MAKERMINTRFWVDPWIQEKLNSLDRFLFLYFLTNDQTNISGIYEISFQKVCFETGIDRKILLEAMIPRLAPKIYVERNWIILVNFPKHQNLGSESVMKGIMRELSNVPNDIYQKAIGYGYPIHRVGDTKLNLTKPTVIAASAASENEIVKEDFDKPRNKKTPDINANTILIQEENKMGRKFANRGKQLKWIKETLDAGYSKEEIFEELDYLRKEHKYWKSKNPDFSTVASTIHQEH